VKEGKDGEHGNALADCSRRLVGWVKVELKPDETKQVSVPLNPQDTLRPLFYWNATVDGWEIVSGEYQVFVAASSRDIRLVSTLHILDETEKGSGRSSN
jgi:Fibronectin type III-like domain